VLYPGLNPYPLVPYELRIADLVFNMMDSTIPTFMTLFVFSFVCQIILLYDTLAQKNSIQLFRFCLYTCSVGVYATLQVSEISLIVESLEASAIGVYFNLRGQLRSLAVDNAIIIRVYTLAVCFISFKLYAKFQWTIYRQLNADVRMQKRYFKFKVRIPIVANREIYLALT
jgi:hypothetical protein